MRKVMILVLTLCGLGLAALPPCVKPIPSIDTALVPKVGYVDQNDDEAFDCINEQGDTLRAMLTALGGTTGSVGLSSTGDIKANIDRDSNTTGSRFWVANHTNDTLFRVSDDLAIKAYGAFNVVGASTLAAISATTGAYSGTLAVAGMTSLGPASSHAQNLLVNGYMEIANDAGNSAEIEFNTTGGTGSPALWRILSLGSVQSALGDIGSMVFRNHTNSITALHLSAAGVVTVPNLAGTGSRLTTSTSTGVLGNATTISGANTWSDKQTHTSAPRFNSVSASEVLMTDGSKDLASQGTSGSGNFVRVTNAVLVTPTLGVAAATRIATNSNTNSVVVTAATDGASSLQVGGSYSEVVEARTANVTLDLTQSTIEANATGGSFTIALPAASGCTGRRYTIHKNDASTNTVTVDGNASETIGGALTIVLGGNVGNSRLIIKSNGTTWRIEDLYEEGTFTAAATGMSACTNGALVGSTCTATAYYTRNGKSIDVYIPDLLGTSSSTSLTVTGLPSFLNASRSRTINLPAVVNNSSNYSGFVILTTGTFTLSYRTTFVDYPSNVYTASGLKGCNSFDFTYTLQ